jgi:CBS domain-containing protein
VVVVALTAGVFGVFLIRFLHMSRVSIARFFGAHEALKSLFGAAILIMVIWLLGHGLNNFPAVLARIASSMTFVEAGTLLVALTICLSVVLGVFGSSGVFWPVFIIGACLGSGWVSTSGGSSALLPLIGGAALWGAFFGAPLAGALLVLEITHEPLVLLYCLPATLLAHAIRDALKTRPFFDDDVETRGSAVDRGRAIAILESITVGDAMVTDHTTVKEHESLADIHEVLVKSRYPFLPVINNASTYVGLLTADMIEEAWGARERSTDKEGGSSFPLSKLLEAKDLLLRFTRYGRKVPTVRSDDPLSVTTGLFEQTPVVPVLDAKGKVVGLLFAYNVRIIYDREAAQRALFYRKRK